MMLFLVEDRRTRAYSMYGVVSAMFSSEGRIPRPSAATIFANIEAKAKGCGVALAKYPMPFLAAKRQEVQNRFMS
jgi:hypothetical protein